MNFEIIFQKHKILDKLQRTFKLINHLSCARFSINIDFELVIKKMKDVAKELLNK